MREAGLNLEEDMKPWIILMPDKWDGEKPCKKCPMELSICDTNGKECPLSNAKEAWIWSPKKTLTRTMTVTLYAVDLNAQPR